MLNPGSCSEFNESMEKDPTTLHTCPSDSQNKIQHSDQMKKSAIYADGSVCYLSTG